jgi:CIC family chloride channel protein
MAIEEASNTAERPGARLDTLARRLLCYLLVGLVAGLGACVFYWLMNAVAAYLLGVLCHYVPVEAGGEPSPFQAMLHSVTGPTRVWLLVLMPALGGAVSSFLVNTFAPEAEGHGTDSAILSYHELGGRIRARVPLIKTLASAVTIGSGGSGGREGPIAQIGAGFGSILGTALKLPVQERRLLMLAGVGAGVGAIFRAPLAGAIFAAEVLYHREEIEHEVLLPATVAAVVAYTVFASVYGHQPLFVTPNVAFTNPLELPGYAVLGVVCAAGGWFYVRFFYGTRDFFHGLPIPRFWHPVIGGLLTGLIGLLIPAALATSYGSIQSALDGRLGLGFLLALAVAKILATSFSIGSGGSGGVFGPAMVIGAALGGATGLVFHHLGLLANPASMVIVGMAGFFAGAANTPLSTIIMVSEMTGNYELLAPSMLCCTVAAVMLRRYSIYENQAGTRAASGAHAAPPVPDALAGLTVAQCMDREAPIVASDEGREEFLSRLAEGGHTRYPVVDSSGRILGLVDTRDVVARLAAHPDRPLKARDVLIAKYAAVAPGLSLAEAAARLDEDPHGMLLVVEPGERGRLLGVLRRQNVVRAYHVASEKAGGGEVERLD